MLNLREDNVEASFTLLGTVSSTPLAHIPGQVLPKETVLTLGIVKS